ncbi:hypothetical protein [Geomesophilobacter sediminis]|uniref:Lipoprotein n=1 Tax=Geomesophilobacter sediminis TaxID=2798584 RepID=A0A8J7M1Y7_9BACT|nr:hypothetical protein [Geomesophilobacter sediminis]MBJ6727205.1 hypothetical protein [Geomesophilobacter sediminis]
MNRADTNTGARLRSETLSYILCVLFVTLMSGCVFQQTKVREIERVERSVTEFEKRGTEWGKKLKKDGINPQKELNTAFVKYLNEQLGYFEAHTELKDAFKRGFRIGYEDRVGDLVLGPHIREAAGDVGTITSGKIVLIINQFDKEWKETLTKAIDIFIVLISEGSQADRDAFITRFKKQYSAKYEDLIDKTAKENQSVQITIGGTRYVFPKELNAMAMPSPETITKRIYSQAFLVMGDEWGRRYSTNLVKRDELVEMLRRCKPALDEGERLNRNLGFIKTAFVNSYGADGENMFRGIMKDAGFDEIKTVATEASR